MINLRRCVAVILLFGGFVFGQDDDEQQPGLHARYQTGDAVVERVDPDIAFVWGDSPPDERLPAGKFGARWSGTILLRGEDKYRFHAYAQGRVELKINQQIILAGEADEPRWISGPDTALTFGDQPFELSFVRTGDSAQLKLYWSSTDFPLEPVPYHSLFQTRALPDAELIERGRVQFDAFRCGSCHANTSEEKGGNVSKTLAAPSLKQVGIGTSREWLVEKLMANGDAKIAGMMPHFGLPQNDAEVIVTALLSNAGSVELNPIGKTKEGDREKDLLAGRTLIRSVGCLACHTWDGLGEETPFGGGSLNELARKRSAAWVNTWLAEPEKLNPSHRMPLMTLAPQERTQIVLALVGLPADGEKPQAKGKEILDEAAVLRSFKLLETLRCASCHELPELKSNLPKLASLARPGTNWTNGCSKLPVPSKVQPGFPHADLQAIRTYVSSWKLGERTPYADLENSNSSLVGQRLLEHKNCLGCHDRDGSRGIAKFAAATAKSDQTLAGLHMTLIPPRLNAVGDRMHDAGLALAIRGEQKTPRLNWLRVRMPRFQHTPVEQAALMSLLLGHDRIPDGGTALATSGKKPITIDPDLKPDPQRLLAGRELLGGKGFSCVACHGVKDYTPKVTALGTRGSNLHLIGQRMRSNYFFRWTRAPLRVMPGVEMPNYQKPHEFILPGQLDQQLIAIWETLNDPKLTAPTNPAVVEQLLTVGDNDEPRVVRDVFTVPDSTDETIARSFAMGLPGGHSVLLDLDTGCVRGWTLGDFARQRCEGKRWYWDLAGTIMASKFDTRPELILVRKETAEVIAPEAGWDVELMLKGYGRWNGSTNLKYEMTFAKNGTTHRLEVVDEFREIPPSKEDYDGPDVPRERIIDGWERTLSIKSNEIFDFWLRNATPEYVHSQSRITTTSPTGPPLPGLPTTAARFLKGEGEENVVSVRYQTLLHWQPAKHTIAPALMSATDTITTVPGFRGARLPLPRSIMPTSMTWDPQGRMLFTSLKGHLFRMKEAADGMPELQVIEEGLAAPFGVIEHSFWNCTGEEHHVLVAHKPEILMLVFGSEGKTTVRDVFATGWGLSDDYHDWTCGFVRNSEGELFIGLGSDYTFKNRPLSKSRWRGDILRIGRRYDPVVSIARGLRYPTGFAIDDDDRLFVSDQQGVQNTFNELNHVQTGHRYGVPSRHETEPNASADPPAVQIPHPWTRSMNGIVFVSKNSVQFLQGRPDVLEKDQNLVPRSLRAMTGHFLGCEYNNNMIIRVSVQTVGDVVQGAVYPFSKPAKEGDTSNFVGPLSIGISPKNEIFVGGFQDGGWVGGLNMGDIVKLTPSDDLPNGIREIRVTRQGFDLEFFDQVDPLRAGQTNPYKISGYTRAWKGDYATPDSGHHVVEVTSATISKDGRTISLAVTGRKTGHVYDVSVGEIGTETQRTLWPAIGHYTLHRIPD